MKRPKWLGESRATKADKQKKVRQQTDQRMKRQDAQSRGDSKRKAKMVLSPDETHGQGKRQSGSRPVASQDNSAPMTVQTWAQCRNSRIARLSMMRPARVGPPLAPGRGGPGLSAEDARVRDLGPFMGA
jgi:hypothetical protein